MKNVNRRDLILAQAIAKVSEIQFELEYKTFNNKKAHFEQMLLLKAKIAKNLLIELSRLEPGDKKSE